MTNDPSTERLTVRIPGLRGVTIRVTVEREVWEFFDGLAGAVRAMPQGTPLEIFRGYVEGCRSGVLPRRAGAGT